MRKYASVGLIALALLAACRDKGSGDDRPTSIDAAASATPSGLASASVDAASPFAKAVRDAAKCAWTDKTGPDPWSAGISAECPAYQALASLGGTEQEAEMIELLGDADRAVRWAAARGLVALTRLKTRYHADASASRRVLTYAERETDEAVGFVLGALVGRIKLAATKLSQPVLALLEREDRDALRVGMIDDLLTWNRDEAGVRDGVTKLARRTGAPKVRVVAVRSLAASGLDPAMCKLLFDVIRDPEPLVSGEAAYQSAGARATVGCAKDWTALIGEIEKRTNSCGASMHQGHAGALARVAGQAEATASQKKQAIAAARRVVETKECPEDVRWRALDGLGDVDPGVKSFAAKLVNDPAEQVNAAAKKIAGK